MPEVTVLFKFVFGLIGTGALGVVTWWFRDLRERQNRATLRTDEAFKKLNEHSEKITRLESETITEVEFAKQMSEMERRIMTNFTASRLEFKGDLVKFGDDIKAEFNKVSDGIRSDLRDFKRYKD